MPFHYRPAHQQQCMGLLITEQAICSEPYKNKIRIISSIEWESRWYKTNTKQSTGLTSMQYYILSTCLVSKMKCHLRILDCGPGYCGVGDHLSVRWCESGYCEKASILSFMGFPEGFFTQKSRRFWCDEYNGIMRGAVEFFYSRILDRLVDIDLVETWRDGKQFSVLGVYAPTSDSLCVCIHCWSSSPLIVQGALPKEEVETARYRDGRLIRTVHDLEKAASVESKLYACSSAQAWLSRNPRSRAQIPWLQTVPDDCL